MSDIKNFYVNNIKIETNKHNILDAILETGYCMSHSCKDGRCGSCEITELNSGKRFLACQTGFKEGFHYETENFTKTRLPIELNIPVKLSDISTQGNFIKVTLNFSKSLMIKALPGQYLDLVINDNTRSYSIFNIDNKKKVLEFVISPKADGYGSNYFLNQKNIGKILRAKGPKGSFIVDEVENCNHIFVCSGSGIVPVYNMLSSLKGLPESSKVYWGVKHKCDFTEAISYRFRESIDIFYSRETKIDNIQSGRLPLEKILSTLNEKTFLYGCGNVEMLKDLQMVMSRIGVDCRGFKMDPFY